jgi:hypothetical protein
MRRGWGVIAVSFVALWPAAALAQSLDCGKPIQRAQDAIEKVTEDMKGMESMPKSQLTEIHGLLGDAKKLLSEAQTNCQHKPLADYDAARAIAKAEGARGAAEAADMLHFQYMKNMSGMKHGASMPGTSMPGMKK